MFDRASVGFQQAPINERLAETRARTGRHEMTTCAKLTHSELPHTQRDLKRVRSLSLWCLSLAPFLCYTTTLGQTEGSIALSGQPNFVLCALEDAPGIRTVYVLHTFNPGATACRFRIEQGTGMNLTYLSEAHPFAATVGNAVAGVSVCYGGACIIGDQLVLSVTYMAYGTSTTCSKLLVAPHPDSETVEAMNCNFAPVRTFVQDMYARSICGCPTARLITGAAHSFDCTPLPVASATWGAIKAMYSS